MLPLAITFLVACSTQKPVTTQEQTIKIGVLVPLTGPNSTLSRDVLNAINMAKDNNDKIELIIEDSQCQPEMGVNAFKKLVETNQVTAVVGIICSSVANAIAPLAQSAETPTILSVGSSYQPTLENNWVFKFWPDNKDRAGFEARFITNNLNAKKITVLYTNNARDKGLYEEFIKVFTGEILLAKSYEQENDDFQTILLQIKNLKPDLLFILGYEPSVISILQQAEELGIKTQFVTTSTIISETFLSGLNGLGEGLLLDLPITRSELTYEFENNFITRFNDKIIHPGAYFAYDSMMILVDVLNDTQDKEQIKNRLHEIETIGVSGQIDFDELGMNKQQGEFGILEVRSGEFVPYE